MDEDTNTALDNAAGGEGEDETNSQPQGPAPEIISQATEMGWVPKEKFRGDPDRWVDAETFVRKGEEVMPLLRANNKRLNDQLAARDAELAENRRRVKELEDSVNAMKEIQTRESVGRVDRQIAATRRNIEEARAERDTDKVIELQATLDGLIKDKADLSAPAKKPVASEDDDEDDGDFQLPPRLQQELTSWNEENSWYGTDKVRTRVADSIARELRQTAQFKNVVGKAFLDEVARRTTEELGDVATPTSKTSGGSQNGSRTSSSSSTSRGKSYNDLPQDAKRQCDRDAERLVGPNKAYKKVEDYHKFYVKEYFGDES